MKKTICLPFLFILFFGLSKGHAQLKGFSFGPYLEAALPSSSFGDNYKNGMGAGVGLDVKLPLTKWSVTGSAGLLHFGGKTVSGGTAPDYKVKDLNAFPIRAGLRYQFSLLYVKMEAGSVNFANGGGHYFLYAPGLGLRFLKLDIEAKYEAAVHTSLYRFLGLKAALNL